MSNNLICVPWRDGLVRGISINRGYDCRKECEHTPKGDHGAHGDEWVLLLKDERLAQTLMLFTKILRGKALWNDAPLVSAAMMQWCTAMPTSDETVRNEEGPAQCPFLGQCYPFGDTGIGADALWRPFASTAETDRCIATALAQHSVVEPLLEHPIWEVLAKRFGEERAKADRQHADLPKRCPTCGGRGLVQ